MTGARDAVFYARRTGSNGTKVCGNVGKNPGAVRFYLNGAIENADDAVFAQLLGQGAGHPQ